MICDKCGQTVKLWAKFVRGVSRVGTCCGCVAEPVVGVTWLSTAKFCAACGNPYYLKGRLSKQIQAFRRSNTCSVVCGNYRAKHSLKLGHKKV